MLVMRFLGRKKVQKSKRRRHGNWWNRGKFFSRFQTSPKDETTKTDFSKTRNFFDFFVENQDPSRAQLLLAAQKFLNFGQFSDPGNTLISSRIAFWKNIPGSYVSSRVSRRFPIAGAAG